MQKGLGRGLNVFFGEDTEEVEKITTAKKEKKYTEIEKVVELNIAKLSLC